MNGRIFLFYLSYFFTLGLAFSSWSQPIHPFEKISQDPGLRLQLEQIVQVAVAKNFGKSARRPQLTEEFWNHSIPLFVTAKKDGQIKGCMGSLQSQRTTLFGEIETNLKKAFSQDPRHPPIDFQEISGMEIYLTAVGKPREVSSIAQIHPGRDGVFIKSGIKEAVILPGEAKTQSYLIKLARAKAGLNSKENFQIYYLPTKILKIVLNP